jgi:hypothetical protein
MVLREKQGRQLSRLLSPPDSLVAILEASVIRRILHLLSRSCSFSPGTPAVPGSFEWSGTVDVREVVRAVRGGK